MMTMLFEIEEQGEAMEELLFWSGGVWKLQQWGVGTTEDTRIIPVIVKGAGLDMLLIAGYLPTGTAREKCIEYQETIDRICTIIHEHGAGRLVVIGGDLNVDLRKQAHANKRFILAMMEEYSLAVPYGLMEGRCSFYTGETSEISLLDYFLVGRKHIDLIRECHVPERSGINRSDHEPVFLRIAMNTRLNQERTRIAKIDWDKARRQGKVEEYQSRLRRSMRDEMTVEDIVGKILQAAEGLPRKGKLNRASQWWTPQLTELRRACLAARDAWKKAEPHERDVAGAAYRQEKRKYLREQKRMRTAREARDDKKLEQQCCQLDPLYYQFMRHSRGNRDISRLIVHGHELFQAHEIAQAFLSHFVKVGHPITHDSFETDWRETVDGVVEIVCNEYDEDKEQLEQVKEITEVEVTEVLKALKRNKAPGSDTVTPEHLIETGGTASRNIASCLQTITRTTQIPENFKCGLITPVYKGHGGDPASLDSYRDISVLSTLCKVFEKILVARLGTELLRVGVPSELQFAYTKDRATLQANFILQEMISANRDLGKTVYVAFLDVKKCFNSVWHNGLLYKLICAGVSPRIVLTLRNLYREFNVRVKIGGELSKDGKIKQGLKQGGVLSTSLLTLFMDDKIKMVQREGIGATIGCRQVGIIAYADDEVLISCNPKEMQNLLDIAYQHSCLWRYRYNVAKCKILVYGKRTCDTKWRLGDEEIESATEYTHLGVIMSPKGAPRRRIEDAMNKARQALYSKCPYGLNISKMNPLTLFTTWRVYAEPALLYSIAVTRLTETELTYLEGMLLRIYRLMQGLPSKIQKMASYVMLGALPCRIMVMKTVLQFISFLFKAAGKHDLTEYVLLHGTQNPDRETSLVRGWEELLAELKLPTLTKARQVYCTMGQKKTGKI